MGYRDPSTQRYPLHEAAANEFSADIIRCMVQIFPKSAVAVDGEGRTPLHLACLSGWSFDEEVANVLCQAGPSALVMECCDGKTPMELIITSGSHVKLEVLDLLHSNTGRYLKRCEMEQVAVPQTGVELEGRCTELFP